MFLANMKIGARLALGFSLVIGMMLIAVALALVRLAELGEANESLIQKEWVKAEAATLIDSTARANARRTMELLIATDATQIARIQERIEANKRLIDTALGTLDRLVYLPRGKALLITVKQDRAAYVASFTRVAKLVGQGERDQAIRLMNELTLPAIDKLQVSIAELEDFQKTIVRDKAAEVSASIVSASLWTLAQAVMAVVVGGLIAVWITRAITRPMNEAVHVAQAVAAGDLTSRIEAVTTNESGRLLAALGDMNASLTRIVGNVHAGSSAISTATGQIAAGNLDLSQRTEEQAAALEQTVASLQELADRVRANSESGQHANALASSAAEVAVRGGEVVQRVVLTMHGIDASSKKIAEIIGVIDGIAFQTNILALNAAVEAARAGDQGRGFAVVASEVRSLAGRSATAAREIKGLIGDSVANVGEGCKLVEQAGSTMHELVGSVRRVADIMGEISSASGEQSLGIDQINQAVRQMDQVTQGNAALVEESAAAAESLATQARALVESVSAFRLAGAPG